jgi:hypothetical protein
MTTLRARNSNRLTSHTEFSLSRFVRFTVSGLAVRAQSAEGR